MIQITKSIPRFEYLMDAIKSGYAKKQLYETFDADQDVLTLETGNDIYRGYFLDFSFTQTAMNPWNWKYTIMFVSLVNLAEYVRRGDDKFPKGQEYETEIIDWNPQNEDILPNV